MNRIVVWCKEESKPIKPCVSKWMQEPPCLKDKCSAICNYLDDHAKPNTYVDGNWSKTWK